MLDFPWIFLYVDGHVHIKTFQCARNPLISPGVIGRLFCYPGLHSTNSSRKCSGLALEH